MKKLFATSLIATSLCLAGIAYADDEPGPDTTIEDAARYLEQIGDTVVTQELIDEARKANQIRDRFRDRSELEVLEGEAINSEISKLSSQRDLITLQFIIDNVPPHILASGQGEVQAYIQNTFVRKRDVSVANNAPSREPSVLWESSNTALTTPYQPESEWVPVIESSDANQGRQPAPIEMPTQSDLDDVGGLTSPDDEGVLTDEEEASLDALGISREELARMFDELPPGGTRERESQAPESVSVNVTIDNIEVNRAVIMGKSSFVDVSLVMSVIRGDSSRRINRNFNNVSRGYQFTVDGVTFELMSIDRNYVQFKNNDSGAMFEARTQ